MSPRQPAHSTAHLVLEQLLEALWGLAHYSMVHARAQPGVWQCGVCPRLEKVGHHIRVPAANESRSQQL